MDQDGYDEDVMVDELYYQRPPHQQQVQERLLVDCTSDAAGYFGGIRVPATLITGSSLGFLFAFSQSSSRSFRNRTINEIRLIRIYHATVLISFSLALTTVIISTSASITLLQGRHNPFAYTAYELLRREFDYEFCVTIYCFLNSLLCFVCSVTCKVILEFDLLKYNTHRRHYYPLIALLSMMVAVLTNIISYVNETLYSWSNIYEFTKYVIHLVWNECIGGHRPLMIVSLLSAIISILCIIKILISSDPVIAVVEDEDQTKKPEDEEKKRK